MHNFSCRGLVILLAFFLTFSAAAQQISFTSSDLAPVTLKNPTSLQFGPDGRLYVSEQLGTIFAYTIVRNGANNYQVTNVETINLVKNIPNYDDDGTLSTAPDAQQKRQITGILVTGTAANPVLYVTSSDPRIGAGSGGAIDLNLDTNSGTISRLTWTGSGWNKVDLVRGLPRSEENHSPNGMQLDETANVLYLAQGGNANLGAPSNNMAFLTEFALAAAILTIDLDVIDAMPTKTDANGQQYKYDLPTVDDPSRANNPDGSDPGDPFGGNDGLNQAKLVPGGPVQIYSPGFRNSYDLVLTRSPGREGRLYTIDNGGNDNWGGYPVGEGPEGVCTNDYDSTEEGFSNNKNGLHFVTEGYYAGHPAPIRGNPAGAGLYTHDGTGFWRIDPADLPVDWPSYPVEMANPIECDYQQPGVDDGSLIVLNKSTNGLAEYTATNFGAAMQGNLLAASYSGDIFRIQLNAAGDQVVTNGLSSLASGFGQIPLDVIAQGDDDIFGGTIWAVTYNGQKVTIFEPGDFDGNEVPDCSGADDPSLDEDGDGYDNADEIDNATNPCSAASIPPDHDGDFVSDLNDPDDDNDGILDSSDKFALDPANGTTTHLPVSYSFFNNDPGTGFFGLGFMGLMTNGTSDYLTLFDSNDIVAGGTSGLLTISPVTAGDATGGLNTQENGFQFGVNVSSSTPPFTVKTQINGPFFSGQTPVDDQSLGLFIGTGDQNNYVKVVLHANGGVGGLQIVHESGGQVLQTTMHENSALLTSNFIQLFLSVDPSAGTVQPKYALPGGQTLAIGSTLSLQGSLLNAVQSSPALAVGLISTSINSGKPFAATWDFLEVTENPAAPTGLWEFVSSSNLPTKRHEHGYVNVNGKFYLIGGRGSNPVRPLEIYDPATGSWSTGAAPPVEMHHMQAVTLNGLIYVICAFTGAYPDEVPLTNIYIYNPTTDAWTVGPQIPSSRRRGSTGVVVRNGAFYVVGGIIDGHKSGHVAWFDKFDPATSSWTQLADAPRARDHFHAAISGDKLYVAGGRRTVETNDDVYIGQVDVFNFTTGQWSTLPSPGGDLPTLRAGAATAVLDGEIIVIGGEGFGQAWSATEALNPSTGSWRALDNLNTARHAIQAVTYNDGIYVVAGRDDQGGGAELTSQERFSFDGTPTITPATLAVSPNPVQFPGTVVGATTTVNLTLSNTGDESLTVTDFGISGADAASFDHNFTGFFSLGPGANAVREVSFTPSSEGDHVADLAISHTGSNSPFSVGLSGQGSGTVSEVARLNSGGAAYSTTTGVQFSADQYFTGSSKASNTSLAVAGTNDDPLYYARRFGVNFGYAIPVPASGEYSVSLHFVEPYFGVSVPGGTGQRVFSVNIENGEGSLVDYDIYADVGPATAVVKHFSGIAVSDGTLNINLTASKDNAIISAIEVLAQSLDEEEEEQYTLSVTSTGSGTVTKNPDQSSYTAGTAVELTASPAPGWLFSGWSGDLTGSTNPATVTVNQNMNITATFTEDSGSTIEVVFRGNAGGSQYTTTTGEVFSTDQHFTGTSKTSSKSLAVAGTEDDPLYYARRFGANFGYAVPVPATGEYAVSLHFVEPYFGVTAPGGAGLRVFSVNIENGEGSLVNYDIWADVGPATAVVKHFSGIAVSDGTLNIDLTASKDNAIISALEVLAQSLDEEEERFTLSVTTNGNGTVTKNPNQSSYTAGTNVELTANPAPGWLFSGWSGDLTGSTNPTTVTVNQNMSVTATFTEDSGSTIEVVFRGNAGGSQYTTSTGEVFSADQFFNGTSTASTKSLAVAGTTDDPLYYARRFGASFGYGIPVPAVGDYVVSLHFAEPYFGVTAPGGAGLRVFTVDIESGEGSLVDYDIWADVGPATAVVKHFSGITVGDDTLNIDFTASANNAIISAIEVLESSGALAAAKQDPTMMAAAMAASALAAATETATENRVIPEAFALRGNYPNPFNPRTVIRYELPEQVQVQLEIFDVLGSRVAVLVDADQSAGIYDAEFDAGSLAGGVYFYRLQAGSFSQVGKMILLK